VVVSLLQPHNPTPNAKTRSAEAIYLFTPFPSSVVVCGHLTGKAFAAADVGSRVLPVPMLAKRTEAVNKTQHRFDQRLANDGVEE